MSVDEEEVVFGDLSWVSFQFASLIPKLAATFPSPGSPELTVYTYTQQQAFAR
jgi:hypothetical protein